jgi:hypothetical protein
VERCLACEADQGRHPVLLIQLKPRCHDTERGHAWRGAALTCVSRPDGICSVICLAETGEKQAAPGNDPAFGCSIGVSDRDTGPEHRAG